jgi:hypothetical protein
VVSVKKLDLREMEIKKIFFSFILLTLIAFKVSATHVYAHEEDSFQVEDCELCEQAIQNQNAEFSGQVHVSVPENTSIAMPEITICGFVSPEVTNELIAFPFTRPPPVV